MTASDSKTDPELHLRDRIAALLELLRPVTPREAADAVIAELGRGEKPCGCRPIWEADDE